MINYYHLEKDLIGRQVEYNMNDYFITELKIVSIKNLPKFPQGDQHVRFNTK